MQHLVEGWKEFGPDRSGLVRWTPVVIGIVTIAVTVLSSRPELIAATLQKQTQQQFRVTVPGTLDVAVRSLPVVTAVDSTSVVSVEQPFGSVSVATGSDVAIAFVVTKEFPSASRVTTSRLMLTPSDIHRDATILFRSAQSDPILLVPAGSRVEAAIGFAGTDPPTSMVREVTLTFAAP
ncbi:MAG: hypothetical protein KDA96_24065 [Planctomycetaceae bacterium]|nr:hypothetical protein [Planctomycetaceae bacterium]